MIANIRALRSSTKEILSVVSRGETVWITNRGKTCAKITGIKEKKSFKDHPAFGMWKDRKDMGKPSEYVRELRRQWGRHVI